MSLSDEYRRQFAFRAWTGAFDLLPDLAGKRVLDLGCGSGEVAAELARLGALVRGFDGNEELVLAARERHGALAEFERADLATWSPEEPCDGIWCSFTAAYFTALQEPLQRWTASLVPGGFIALAEVDDLFGHEPLDPETRALFDAYASEALEAKRYDFHMGVKLREILAQCGFELMHELTLPDHELAFDGAAPEQVLQAWRTRLQRMQLLQAFFGERYEGARDELLACLASPRHRARARVVCCIARKPPV